jgi:hypothetical protein
VRRVKVGIDEVLDRCDQLGDVALDNGCFIVDPPE